MLSLSKDVATEARITNALAKDGSLVTRLRAALPEAIAIYAFGSRVQGQAGPDSDLDLAVLVAAYADPLLLWQLTSELADQVGCAVDLLDLRAASTVMQYQVLSNGRKLWSVEPAASLFECYVLSEKTALDGARAGLLADIAKEGKVYG